jgi:sigma-B regulation protein RsbU (phosphoserine phosphatase)
LSVWKKITRKLAESGMVPHTRLAWFTVYLAAVEVTLILVKWLLELSGARSAADPLSGWIGFLAFVLGILGLFLALRWFRIHVMWSVRNRLIVTYLFIGGVPVTLVLLIAVISAYFLVGQFAASLPVSALQAELKRLQTVNSSTARIVARRAAAGRLLAVESLPEDPTFPEKTVQVDDSASLPNWLTDGFNNLVLDQNRLYLRAANTVDAGGRKLTVISSVPVDGKFLAPIAAEFGQIQLYIPRKDDQGNVNLTMKPGRGVVVNGSSTQSVTAGSLSPSQNRWDMTFGYHTLLQPVDWETGRPLPLPSYLVGTTRISVLYAHLSGALSQWTSTLLFVLAGLVIIFGVIVLIALIIGIRLTRTITYSVANLYKATQHINRGDFDYRIQVREKDQLAALQTSFNSMTQSLQKLIAEQKEKERLQSELEIAHEVQAQLFPRDVSGTRTLEMHGICRPARIVSGDYYDFLSLGPDQAGIAVGDISGKGISAALLMATIHSAVRAYQQEAAVSVREVAAYGTSGRVSSVKTRVGLPSPAQMLWLLNHHLYQTTQPEKYATLFLGFYDGETRRFTYSNAGHLAPIILSQNGDVRRLEAGGMVVGLFDHMEYAEETVELYPGDIFIAFSDGMTEPENEFGEFGEERLLETITAHRNLPLEHISAQAVSAVQDWIGSAEQPDDITLVLARPASPDVI